MKKVITILTSVMAIVVLSVMMAACSTGIEGTWKFSSSTTTFQEQTHTMNVGDEIDGPDGTKIKVTEDFMTLEIRKDGTFTFTGMGEKSDGTWEKKDGKYISTIVEGEEVNTLEWKLEGKSLVFELNGEGYSSRNVLKK